MNRTEFLSALGIGAVAMLCSSCMEGCTPADQGPTAPANVDFTLDLTNPAYAGLAAAGGSIDNNGVTVAHTPSGYVAVSSACTHQGATITYDKTNNYFYCPAHGSIFATTGTVSRGPAGTPLAAYHVTLSGNSLRVYS
jgi:cytochrome b6-f complex iron-sulfur subunit